MFSASNSATANIQRLPVTEIANGASCRNHTFCEFPTRTIEKCGVRAVHSAFDLFSAYIQVKHEAIIIECEYSITQEKRKRKLTYKVKGTSILLIYVKCLNMLLNSVT